MATIARAVIIVFALPIVLWLASCDDRVIAQLEADQITADNITWLQGRPVLLRGQLTKEGTVYSIMSRTENRININIIDNPQISNCIDKFIGDEIYILGIIENINLIDNVAFIIDKLDDRILCVNSEIERRILTEWHM